jgi:serine phosphatase RsbU (regulator of sigma subunit)
MMTVVTSTHDPSLAEALADPARLRALELTALLDTPAERAFDRLTALASRELGVPVALVTLVTPDRQFFKSQCGLSGAPAAARETPLSHSFCQHVVHKEEALVVSDARREPDLADNLAISDLGAVAYAGFPLRLPGGEVLGSFCAIDTRPRTWMPHELELLRDMAATTMDIVTLRMEAVTAGDAAARFQEALVPEPARLERGAVWSAFRPGDARLLLGGDFFACAEGTDGCVSLIIGDVAGHGPEAAGFATGLRSAWQALRLTDAPLEQLAATLNAVARSQPRRDDRFATALLAHLAPDRRSAQLVSAGHPPVVLLGDGPAREVPVRPGPPLGGLPDASWPASRVELPDGSRLLFATDGLAEARADAGRLGIGRVLEECDRLLAGGRDGAALLAGLLSLLEHDGHAAAADDVALLLVRPD